MAVGTEVAHPVNILDGVSKVPVAVSSKGRSAAVDNSGVEHAAAETVAEANFGTAISNNVTATVSLSSIAEGDSDETQPVTSPSTSTEKVTCAAHICT